MKSFTDIDQSKVLAEMLPLESADMVWIDYGYCKRALPKDDVDAKIFPAIVPTWSLSALLDYLKQRYYVRLDHDGVSWSITCIEHDTGEKHTSSMSDDPIDACLGMILRLNEEELEYEKKYKNALEWARQVRDGKTGFIRKEVEEVFPELKGSEDENIRKAIIALIEFGLDDKSAIAPGYNITKEEALAWLEKQESVEEIVSRCKTSWYNEGKIAGMAEGLTNDEKYQQGWHDVLEKQCGQKSINDTDEEIVNATKNTSVLYMVEPKFKVGDWIVSECGNVACVEAFDKTLYYLLLKDGYHESMLRDYVDKCWRLWSIKDAKDGDVLVDKYNNIGIFKECKDIYWLSHIYLGCDDELRGFNVGPYHEQADTYPATKEQCDLLFKKMKEEGYDWDIEKKELKKINQKPTCSEEDDRIVRDIVRILKGELNYTSKEDADKYIAWLEKRGEQEQDVRYRYLEDLIVADDIHQMAMNDAMVQEARSKAIDALSKLGVSVLLGLEKQGNEPVWCHHKVDLSDCTEEYCKAYYDGWNNCNMQHSQCKSELDDVVKCLINGMKFYYEDNEEATWGTDKWSMPVKHIIEVLEKQCNEKKELKLLISNGGDFESNNSKQKHTWNEEDEKRIDRICDFVWKNRKGDTDEIYQQEQDVKWLKSLKDIVQPKQQWSEEDKMFVHGLIRGLTAKRDIHGHTTFSSDYINITETIHWLESLKQRLGG